MINEYMWNLIIICLFVSLFSGACLWFLLPRKWIVLYEEAIRILPPATVPPWSVLNITGKIFYLLFISGGILMFVILFYGILIE
jgi:hypothetical protein